MFKHGSSPRNLGNMIFQPFWRNNMCVFLQKGLKQTIWKNGGFPFGWWKTIQNGWFISQDVKNHRKKKTGLGWWDCISNYIYETTTCLFSLINCDMNSTYSTLLPNSATLRKNNNTTNTRCVYSGRKFHPTIWPGQVSFPWIWWRFFNPPGTLGFQSTGGKTETFR